MTRFFGEGPLSHEWWHQLLDGEATAGQLQLVHQSRRSRWELHIRDIEFVDDLPMTSSGKIRRVELREREELG
ncbi:hypothetical protein [Halobaculum gomorrense]|uniref:hypothetical protein n=1 Tax=Halobaculum gomorrense TaxID=43928 RepID=UPI0009345C07|nr:hypothetical protein [Halobaculum gomorrense]